jgi:hypothetical protein
MDAPALPTPAIETVDKPVRPLLPPVLLGPAAILWLWVLPVLVLLALNLQGYGLIEGNMNAEERTNAHLLGLAGVLNVFAGLALFVAVRRRTRRDPESTQTHTAWWGLPAIVVQAAYLWLATSMSDDLLPRSVTDWIYPPQRFLYNQFAFAMPALFWGMMRLACARPANQRGKALVTSFALAIGAPLLLFLVFQILINTESSSEFGAYFVSVLMIGLGVAMFVALIRVLALGLRDVEVWNPTTERIAILIFALAMPLGGLLLNREIPFPNDFQAWEVYALTITNAAMLLIASCWHARRPLLSLGLLCATLPFTLYFFVVFLPFLPLSILAVIVFGAGFLVLTPTVLLILHLGLLNKARRGSSGCRLVTGVLCFLLLPGFFTVRGLADKAALNAALDYVYSPAITAGPISYESSRVNLWRALSNHRSYKNGIYYPLLSDYYAWLVFDDLVLPDDKLARLENAFFGESGSMENNDSLRRRDDVFGGGRGSSVRDRHRMPRSAPPPRTVEVESLNVNTKAGEGATTVTLSLTLRNTGSVNAEYIKTLTLPAGVFVSGFRLHINGSPVPGRITEKKTALWVYTMIRDSERRDPGLLFYNAPDELELRVFPIVPATPSVVEIDFLVPTALSDAGVLGGSNDPSLVLAKFTELIRPRLAHVERGSVVALGEEARALPAASRDTYLHVIVDRSEGNGFDGDLASALSLMRKEFPAAKSVRVTLANYETAELSSETASLNALPLRGGFVPDLALAQALRQHRDADLDAAASGGLPPRPVFVILSRKSLPVAPELSVAKAWADVVPAMELHNLDANGAWAHWPVGGDAKAPLLRLGKSVRPWVSGRALRFAKAAPVDRLEYWSSQTSMWQPVERVAAAEGEAPWTRAVGLQLQQQDHERTPGDAGVDLKALVAASRESGVMLASTSYIVVENSAQWRMLEVSERKKLDQNSALNFKEAPAPSATWLILGFGLWLGLRRRWFARNAT